MFRKLVGIVIIDFNQQEITQRCIKSLLNGSYKPENIVLVENGMKFDHRKDNSLDDLNITVLSPSINLGCAGGRNLGLNFLYNNTRAEIFVVLDNDITVSPDFVDKVSLLNQESMKVYAPLIYDQTTGDIWSSGGSIEKSGMIKQFNAIPNTEIIEVDWSPGACLIMGRETWNLVGEFDTWLSFLFEDIDWCHRLKSRGGSVLIRCDMNVSHLAHQSLGGKWSPARVYLWARNGTVFRINVVKVQLKHVAIWLLDETRLAIRDILTGKFKWGKARLKGLFAGIIEAIKRG